MIALIIKALTSRLAGPIATAAAIGLGLALVFAQVQLSTTRSALGNAQDALERAQTDLSTCRSNTAALTASIDAQNKALDAMKVEGDRKATEVAKALQAAKSEAERANRAAKALAGFKPVGADLCARMLEVDEKVKEIAG